MTGSAVRRLNKKEKRKKLKEKSINTGTYNQSKHFVVSRKCAQKRQSFAKNVHKSAFNLEQ